MVNFIISYFIKKYQVLCIGVIGAAEDCYLRAREYCLDRKQFNRPLASNQIIVVPSTVQLYSFVNNTTGAYTLTVKTSISGGATVSVPQGGTLILVCDGTNVYNAASGTASSFTTITLGNGSLVVPSLKFVGDANTGLYLPSTNTLGVVVNNTLIGSFTTSGLSIVGTVTASGGISGGTF